MVGVFFLVGGEVWGGELSRNVVMGLGSWREDLLVVFLFAQAIESGGLGAVVAGVRVVCKRVRWKIHCRRWGSFFFFERDYVEMRSIGLRGWRLSDWVLPSESRSMDSLL